MLVANFLIFFAEVAFVLMASVWAKNNLTALFCGADQCGGTADRLYGRAGLLWRMAVHPASGRGHRAFQRIDV